MCVLLEAGLDGLSHLLLHHVDVVVVQQQIPHTVLNQPYKYKTSTMCVASTEFYEGWTSGIYRNKTMAEKLMNTPMMIHKINISVDYN